MEGWMKILTWVAGAMAVAGCDATIHVYPRPGRSRVAVEVNVDRRPPVYYKEVVYGEGGARVEREMEATRAEAYAVEDSMAMRVVVELFEVPREGADVDEGRLVERREVTVDRLAGAPQDTLWFEVGDGVYRALAWADYVPADGGTADWHFETDTLDVVRARLDHHPGDNHEKSCAAGRVDFSVDFGRDEEGFPLMLGRSRGGGDGVGGDGGFEEAEGRMVDVGMERPAGRWRLWTTDLAEFEEAGGRVEELRVRLLYRQYVAVGFDVGSGEPNDFARTREVMARPTTVPGDGTVLLAYDYVLTGSEGEDMVVVDVVVEDGEGREVNRYEGLRVPLWRNRETVVRGPFLTRRVEANGVGVDEEFDDEFIIEF